MHPGLLYYNQKEEIKNKKKRRKENVHCLDD